MDLSDLAVKLVKHRIGFELGGLLFDLHHRADIPKRTDQGKPPPPRNHARQPYGEREGVHTDARPVPRSPSRMSIPGFRKPGTAATTTGSSRCHTRDAT